MPSSEVLIRSEADIMSFVLCWKFRLANKKVPMNAWEGPVFTEAFYEHSGGLYIEVQHCVICIFLVQVSVFVGMLDIPVNAFRLAVGQCMLQLVENRYNTCKISTVAKFSEKSNYAYAEYAMMWVR